MKDNSITYLMNSHLSGLTVFSARYIIQTSYFPYEKREINTSVEEYRIVKISFLSIFCCLLLQLNGIDRNSFMSDKSLIGLCLAKKLKQSVFRVSRENGSTTVVSYVVINKQFLIII